MGYDDEPRDPFRGDWGSHSKKEFLRIAVECGAALTGYYESVEVPYYGAHEHGEELVREGMLTKQPSVYCPGGTIWIPTIAGKILGQGP